MNYIDLILVILIILSAISGFKNGLIAEAISIAALVLGIWGAIEFSYITTDVLTEKLNVHSKHLNLISFGVTYIIIVILVHIVGNTLGNIFETVLTGPLNRFLGFLFAGLRSALFLSILLLLFDKIDNDVSILPPNKKAESKIYEPVRDLAPSIFPFVKDWVGKL
jgi:membrane protein required for colicin V production